VLPPCDLEAVAATATLVRDLVAAGSATGAHDVAEGGVLAALAEMAVGGGVGFQVARLHTLADLFGESPGRVVLCVAAEALAGVVAAAEAAGVEAARIGLATGDRLHVKDVLDLSLDEAATAWRDHLPAALGHGTTQG
jgi:phosphoribosylformylglycinamidine synthase